MTPEDIANLQRDFGLSFPEDYIRAVTGEVAQSLKAYSLEVAESEVREANSNFRKECPWDFAWEKHFWWIGEDGAGGFYFIDTMESPCRVYYFDHESSPLDFTDRSEFYPSDIGNHLSDAIELEAEGNAYDERMKDGVQQRKWWQFWIPRSRPPNPKQNDSFQV